MLTKMQEDFCRACAAAHSRTDAAIAAGYGGGDRRKAAKAASQLMRKPEIRERVACLEADALGAAGVTPEYLVARLREVAERCLQTAPVTRYDPKKRCSVEVEGEYTFNAAGANKALEMLARLSAPAEAGGEKQVVFEGEHEL